MNWEKKQIILLNGEAVTVQAPVIISASRATDIPAFYMDWLVSRIQAGYVKWINPFNGVPMYVSFDNARLIVFWSKNPGPLLKHLDFFDERIPNYYIQFTLNDYEKEEMEPGVPSVVERVDTFIRLSERLGKEKVIWRFDPLLLTDTVGVEELLEKIRGIGDQLKGYTEKLVFSFADISIYRKVQQNLRKQRVAYREFDEHTMEELAAGLQQLNHAWGFTLATCAERFPLDRFGVVHNSCIDEDLIIRLFHHDKNLMDFLKVKVTFPDLFNPVMKVEKVRNNKDRGQRGFCGCMVSKDIGEYHTCPHGCVYCYANVSSERALVNWRRHKENPGFETIKGV
ncbi:MAG: DUF1848 domain-containing protein [Tannerellaceae bacterium]|nr:DUF1848 domain-containing protein [Tannerellaceae bacterium]